MTDMIQPFWAIAMLCGGQADSGIWLAPARVFLYLSSHPLLLLGDFLK